jgi:RimJ/RimL family protein N-acetyltransferase
MFGDDTAHVCSQVRIISELKAGARPEFPRPILTTEGCAVGSFFPITASLAANPNVIQALYSWRRANMGSFLTIFDPTLEKTIEYLVSFLLPDPARILFLLCDIQHQLIGHIGFCNISGQSAEVDNVIRGEPGPIPEFMTLALTSILSWAFDELRVSSVYLQVLSHNDRALTLYRKVGLIEVARVSTKRIGVPGGEKFVPAPEQDNDAGNPTIVRMERHNRTGLSDRSK